MLAQGEACHSRRAGGSPKSIARCRGAAEGCEPASIAYLLMTPVLEASPGWGRELQGLSWNLVPFLTVLGAVTGWMLARPRR
jgi:hypothetical protein